MTRHNEKRNGVQELLKVPVTMPVVDAAEKLLVVVEQLDCDLGFPDVPDACAFSVATRRMYGEVVRAVFYKTKAYLIYPRKVVRYVLSDQARLMIKDYDEAKTFAPGGYLLLPPNKSAQIGRRHDRGSSTRSGTRRLTSTTVTIRGHKVRTAF